MKKITKCRSCGSDKLTDILNLGDQYLSDFINPKDPKPPKAPLELVLCRACTLIQLGHTTPRSDLYTPRYGYKSGISTTMRQELASIVTEATKRVELQPNDVVIDIGANDGTLLANYIGVYRVAFEPIVKFAEEIYREKRAELVVNDYFTYQAYVKYCMGLEAKIVTAIAMFYDLDEPNAFVADVAKILADDGLFVIQQNYAVGMLKQKAFDNIVHEHLEYYSLTSLEKLLNRHGLEVVDVELRAINGGSFRTYVRHMSLIKKLRYLEKKMNLDNQWTYLVFELEIKNIKKKLVTFISDEVKKGKTVYVLGASTRGNTLLQYCGLDRTLIRAAVERNPEKVGKVIGASGIPIVSEEQARKEKPDYMLVLPWFFAREIKSREAEYVKDGGVLIFPLPDMEVYRG